MKIFKEVIGVINRTVSTFCLGYASYDLFTGDYKTASWMLFITSILFMVGYFTERWSK